ncbi:hypothetical protein M5C72_08445 [Companilactobacillus allii]|uniref:Phage tail protein n=1 Tax=Companilactobacillus allii TaxID=1847728 RepID=A0A1P8Q5H8_9LACO|nr:hypothetical protein [Companilactobacillus allii]APX73110.1 hypothetical protein BTM29_11350 [Companilactobacillus allii]USQ67911.1 hypothetical protein M5C72_08445 [Companilactobacillus allii]
MIKGDFLINGKTGMLGLHSFLESYPIISIPKMKKTMEQIEGANFQSILNEDSYDNRSVELHIVVQADNELDRTMRVSALISAFNSPDYVGFTYYGEPNFVYYITNAEEVTQSRVTRTSYWTALVFKLTAKAFKYYEPEVSYEVNGSLTLENKFSYASRPLIKFNSGGSLAINSDTFNYTLPSGGATVDALEEQQDVYTDTGLVDNAFDMAQEFPQLYPGTNTITADATIWPRWRTI